ncbi:MAG TPA: hypothetical protein PKM01_11520 [Anaerolineaceae bacterium]|nr:hypothetical protein [Anaerolineaceae bacterium]
MATPSPASPLNCTQCGGELQPEEGQIFLTCPHCSSTVYLDKTQVVFHWSLAPTLSRKQAAAALASWMSGSQTVKDLDKKARITELTITYFPLWYFQVKQSDGNETIWLQPAAATAITELKNLQLPAGDLRPYDPAIEMQCSSPTVPLSSARDWVMLNQPASRIVSAALVHVPIFIFKYEYQNDSYTAVVEAATGQVITNNYPFISERPYRLMAGLTAGVYILITLLAFHNPRMIGVSLVIGMVMIPILIALATWMASKV